MEHWIRESRQILDRSATGALPLSELKEELARAGVRLGSRERWLLTALESRRELFRIIRVPPGPWTLGPWRTEEIPALDDPWIVLQGGTPSGFGPEEQILGQIREVVRVWGLGLDDGSASGVARWIRVSQEGTSTCRALFRGPLRAG